MTNIEIEQKDDYIDWLENLCLSILRNEKNISKEKIINKIQKKGIQIENDFIDLLYKKNNIYQKQNGIVRTLPLLKTYPIGLDDDISFDDEKKIYNWQEETIKKLLSNLEHQYEGQDECEHITVDMYIDFFDREVKPYSEYLTIPDDKIYEKILPRNIQMYWGYKIDKTIPWKTSNVAIFIGGLLESDYLNKDKNMQDFNNLIKNED